MTPFRYSKGLNHYLDYSRDEGEREESEIPVIPSNGRKVTDEMVDEILDEEE